MPGKPELQSSNDALLRTEQEEYKQIFEVAGLGIAKVATDGSFLEVNDKLCDLLQYPREELLSKTFQDITHPEDLNKDLSYLHDMLDRKIDQYSMEKRYFKKDGSVTWIKLSVTLVFSHDGIPNYFVSILDDINDKVTNRNKLLEQNKQNEFESESYRKLLENISVGIIIYDLQGRVITANKTQADMLGYSVAEMKSLSVLDWNKHLNPKTFLQLVQRVKNETVEFEAKHYRKDGTTYDALVVTGSFTANGIKYLHSTIRDITEQKQAEKRILAERNQAQHFLDIAGNLIVALDKNGNTTLINNDGCRILEIEEKELIGKHFFQTFLREEEFDMVMGWFSQLMTGEMANLRHTENFIYTFKGNKRLIAWHNSLVFDENGEISGLLSSGEDITEQRQLQQEIIIEKERFELAISGTQDGLWDWDLQTNLAYHSERFETMLGYSGSELPDTTQAWAALVHPEDFEKVNKDIQDYFDSKGSIPYQSKFRMRTKTGEWCWVSGRGKATFSPDGKPLRFIGFNTDINNEVEHNQALEFASKHDLLTGLANRLLLNEILQQEMQCCESKGTLIAVLYIDLDGFKEINDIRGHHIGDLVLKEVASRIKNILPLNSQLARLGGDEFVLMITDIAEQKDVLRPIKSLLKDISKPLVVGNESVDSIFISASVGVSYYPQASPVGTEVLLRQADQAMYQAKKQGKDQYAFFDHAHDEMTTQFQKSLKRIKEGLELNEFELYYQPKIEMSTGQVLGFEALLRWNDPQIGLRTPESFLETVHESKDIMIKIGQFVFEHAFKQMSVWNEQGFDWQISINVSNHELHDSHFLDNLKSLLNRYKSVSAKSIELEILESVALQDIPYVKQRILELQSIGFSIALDDFGTAYSTLSYLKELPINTLKIDKSFVQDMMINSGSLSIIEASIALANAFRCKVIAEGVETIQHRDTLLRFGCCMAQGYLFAKPMPASAIANWIDDFKKSSSCNSLAVFDVHKKNVLYALLDHNNWVSSVKAFIKGEQTSLPAMNTNACHFGEWLDNTATREALDESTLKTLHQQHELVHEHAQKIMKSTQADKQSMHLLNKHHDSLIAALEKLLK